MDPKPRKKRVPKLKYTTNQNIGWHVSFRDHKTGMPRRHRFGMVSKEQAEREYHAWVRAATRLVLTFCVERKSSSFATSTKTSLLRVTNS